MKSLPSNKKLMSKYNLNEVDLFKIMHACIGSFLSEEELYEFILEFYMGKEERINKRLQV